MKKLGIIGGAGPLASALFYETLIHESYSLGRDVPEIVLLNYPFTRGLSLQEGRENELRLKDELNYCIQNLVNFGVEVAVLACNTLHLILKKLSHASIQFHYLPEIVVRAAKEKAHHRLLILGTQNTCHSHLYQVAAIQPLYPCSKDQQCINEVIDRVLMGEILREDAMLVSRVIQQTSHSNEFDGVVLGCTDFPVLHHRFPISSVKPLYDSIKIPAKALVGFL